MEKRHYEETLDHIVYLMYTLDKFVEEDYSLVYFHYGLTSKNKPPLSWLWQAYRAFDRKYKKNLKALYLVHPTNFIRVIWQIFRAAIRLCNEWAKSRDRVFLY
ncbi:Rho GTPase-activating protein 8 [Blattella germanica]|nr:Rho GTPase-activating protein 8 [Blattella germanica]